jgi:hypothetical protein
VLLIEYPIFPGDSKEKKNRFLISCICLPSFRVKEVVEAINNNVKHNWVKEVHLFSANSEVPDLKDPLGKLINHHTGGTWSLFGNNLFRTQTKPT